MKRLCHVYLLLTAFLMLSSCAQENNSIPDLTEYPIRWNVNLEQGKNARALIDGGALLQSSCTETADGTNESIGVWGQYTFENQIVQEFENTALTYASYAWNYSGNACYWSLGAVYDFRAYYPQTLMTRLMTEKSATLFKGEINTSEVQKDILVTALQVDTRTANLNNPVPLNMQHVFSAVMFKVKAVDGFSPSTGEGITSCWLQNSTNATDLFSTSGTLKHLGNATPEIQWEVSASTTNPMYLWEHEGLGFDTETESTLYVNNYGREGRIYTNNDGWLLVIPQQVKAETLTFCYTMKKAGDKVFTVKIPAITYEAGKKYNYLLEISGSNAKLSLGIQPWNEKNVSHNIDVTEFKEKPKFILNNGPINDNTDVKDKAFYLIYNKQSGEYLFANANTSRVDAGNSYNSDGVIDPNYVWRFNRVNTYNYYFQLESMGNSGEFMYCNQMTANSVPLTMEHPTIGGYFSLRNISGGLRFLSTVGNNTFLAVINGVVCGISSGYTDQRNFELYEVVEVK